MTIFNQLNNLDQETDSFKAAWRVQNKKLMYNFYSVTGNRKQNHEVTKAIQCS